MNPEVLLFSSPNFLAVSLVKKLLANKIKVIIVSAESASWKKIFTKEEVSFLNNNAGVKSMSYAFVIDLDKNGKTLTQASSYFEKDSPKTLLILSSFKNSLPESLDQFQEILKKNKVPIKLVYLGEIFAPGMEEVKNPFNQIIYDVARCNKVTLSKESIFYPCYLDYALDFVVREIFTYGYNQKFFLRSTVSSDQLLNKLKSIKKNLLILEAPRVADRKLVEDVQEIEIPFKDQDLTSTLNALKLKLPSVPKIETQKPAKVKLTLKATKKFKFKKPLVTISLILFWIFIIPFVCLFVSGVSLFFAYKGATRGHLKYSKPVIKVSKNMAQAGKSSFGILSQIPFVGVSFNPMLSVSDALLTTSLLAEKSFTTLSLSKSLVASVLGDKDYDLENLSTSLYYELDAIYKDSSLLEGNIKGSAFQVEEIFPEFENASLYRQNLWNAKEIVRDLPKILGMERPTTFLILLQNNMELRPTGGFIGSFALATFSKGKLIDFTVYDTYTADGQLKGYINPPNPIRDYLGEESWYLRDSNWDPDFKVSAKRAEWFLDKSMDRKVDGTVAVDLETIKSILKTTGPITITDYNDEIDYKNLYEKVQYEVEKDFFPGSRKKANYLSALTQTLFEKLKTVDKTEMVGIGRGVLASLNSKDIQLFIHEDLLRDQKQVFGWDGEVATPSCSGNCVNLWLGLVEANLGVNKANYFIKRSSAVMVEIDPTNKVSKNTLKINFTNTSKDASREPETRYKNYLRIILPKNSKVEKVIIKNKISDSEIQNPDITYPGDHQEVGFLIDIPPSEERSVEFIWSSPLSVNFDKKGSLEFLWRKQAGVEPHPVGVFFKMPQNVKPTGNPAFSLTKAEFLGYNTILARDFEATISW